MRLVFFLHSIQGFGEHKFMSITKEDFKFKDGDEDLEKRRENAYKKKFEPLTKLLKKMFGSSVTKVVVSSRLEKAPAMISSTKYSHSANMNRFRHCCYISTIEYSILRIIGR